MLVVAAAGNENSDNDLHPVFPASYDLPNILSVASVNNEGFLGDFTNYGFESVDLSAPGEDILSSAVGGGWEYLIGHVNGGRQCKRRCRAGRISEARVVRGLLTLRDHLIATAKALPSTLGWVAAPRVLDARAAVVSRPDIRRLSGSDRHATAAAISAATFTPGVPYLFIAAARSSRMRWPGVLAAQLGSPLLLVRNGSIPDATNVELVRLRAPDIFVLGGPSAVSDGVVAQLRSYASTQSVVRVAGANRYATAAAISAGFAPGVPNVFIATGRTSRTPWPGVPASAALSGPLLLVAQHSDSRRDARGLGAPRAAANRDSWWQRRGFRRGGASAGGELHRRRPARVGGEPVRDGRCRHPGVLPSGRDRVRRQRARLPRCAGRRPFRGCVRRNPAACYTDRHHTCDLEQVQRLQPARIFVLGGPAACQTT